MKLAFSTVACNDLGYIELADAATKTGVHAVEIRIGNDNSICGQKNVNATAIKKYFDDKNIKVTDLGTSVTIVDYEPEKINAAMECIKIASELGAKGIRIFLGNFIKKFSQSEFYNYDGVVKSLCEICKNAMRYDVEIWVETHNEFSTGKVLKKLADDVGEENLKFIWDIIHPIEMGEAPEETMKYIGDKIAHVHIKDGRKSADEDAVSYIYTNLGEGELPVHGVIDILNKNDYDGYLSLEWEKMWRPEIADCYDDIYALLFDYKKFMSGIKYNLLPPLCSDEWYTYVPKNKSIAEFERGTYSQSLNIKIDSDHYGVGKWICTTALENEKTYDFSVVAKTDCEASDVYVIATVFDSDGNMITREHIRNYSKEEYGIRFWDKIEATEKGVRLEIELWLKGYKGVVRWCEPTLVRGESSKSRVVKIALAYIEPNYHVKHTIEGNVSEIIEAIDCSAEHKPDVIVLSEGMYERSVSGVSLAETAQGDDGEMCTLIAQKAKWYRSYIVYNFHEVENGEYYNTSVMFDRNGDICGKYRKTHLTVTEFEKGLTPGREYPVFETDFGRVGMLICYDHYFPKTVEKMKDNGAEIIFISTAGDAAERSVARAMDNGIYLAICGLNNENSHGWGAARIIDPDGRILSHTNKSGSPAVCEIDLNRRIRRRWLSVGDAAADIYGVFKYERNTKAL